MNFYAFTIICKYAISDDRKYIHFMIPYRFGYNKETEKCEEFVYGGCKGNENSFMSIEECTNTCGEGGISRDMCLLSRAPGPCKDSLAKW